ncbi:MAG TPA: metallophosphoesterase family protein [Bryobacteraceae bacterium]|nr:metallophosphoesterase family protein [Bryobacteraceae bacterium]
MRLAVISDIHGNRTAFEAVLEDLRETSPDLILHGGDLAQGGSSPAEVLDHIRELGWQGVMGNVDEMFTNPETYRAFTSRSPHLQTLWMAIDEMAESAREALGDERIAWLRMLPRVQFTETIALMHASPGSTWDSPIQQATDAELGATYSVLGRPIVVYGHIHVPFVRKVQNMVVVNTGSVSLSYDGDPRAAYLLLDGTRPTIRRVEYNIEQELGLLAGSGIPHADWIASSLKAARPQMP